MIHRRLVPLILVALPAFALDEFQPAEEGVIAVDVRNSLDFGTGTYDPDGTLREPFGDPMTWSPALQLRMGLPNLTEISLKLPMAVMNKDALGRSSGDWGFQQSSLGFKLGLEDWGVALVGGVDFPLGTTKIIGDDPRWKFTMGGIGHWERKKFLIDGLVTWTVTPQDQDGIRRGDVWNFVARPQWRLDSLFTPYLGVLTRVTTAGKIDEKRDGVVSHHVRLEPGTFVNINEEWSLEVKAPFSVAGDWPEVATAGVYAGVTFNMGP